MANLETIQTDPFEVPTSRIGDASNASDFLFTLLDADNLRSQHRAKIKGQYDGNAPYRKSELDAKGLGASCNLNFREAASIIDQLKTPYYDLAVEVPMLANIVTTYGSVTERDDYSQIISEEFHQMVTGWSNWDFIEQFHQFQMILMGSSICYFHDAVDWRPDVAKAGEFLVPDGTRSNLDELEIIVILKSYASHQLYRYIRNEKQASQIGWNVDATRKAIIDAYSGSGEPPTDVNSYEWYQQKLKNADLYYGTTESKAVYVAHELVKEFDERVSHHMVRGDRTSNEFLYSNVGRFASMSDIVCPFFYDIGDGTWHSIRGKGYDIFAYCEIFNRLRGREVDGAMIASSILFQQQSADAVTKSQLLTIQNMGIVPSGLNVLDINIANGIQATSSVRRDMAQGLYQNIGSSMPVPGQAQSRSGQKVDLLQMQQNAQIGKGAINRYYTNRDHLLSVMYKRASNPNVRDYHPGGKQAMDFQNRCIRRGVPIEALSQIDSVKAMRSIGAGSAINGIMVAEAIMEHAGSYPEEGRELAIRDWISRFAGANAANRYMGEIVPRETTEDDSIAQLENNALRVGGVCVITMEQSHVIHLESHLGDMEAHTLEVQNQGAQQGMNPSALQSLIIHLDAGGRHSAEHLQAIQNDPIRKNDFVEFYKRWQQLARVQDQAKQQFEQMQQAQAKESQQNPLQLEAFKKVDYKTAPESVKQQIEQAATLDRGEGSVSVAQENVILKQQNTALKAQHQQQTTALKDTQLAHQIIMEKSAASKQPETTSTQK